MTAHDEEEDEDGTKTPTIASLADEVIAEIFSFLDAPTTARCGKTNQNWNRIVRHSRALWRRFVYQDFGLAQGKQSADWYAVYAYLKTREHAYFEDVQDCFIPSRLVWCDDGSHQPGNNPEHALTRNPQVCWCTNAFVDHDVDLVADLQAPHLVMALEVSNGNARFSAPVREALGFASLELPNLEAARQYDGAVGIDLARRLQTQDLSLQQQSLPPGHPLAGFCFPGIPRAYSRSIAQPTLRPTVARYVHFKLLSSSKCINRVSNNIDVCTLLAFGVPLPRLNELVMEENNTNNNNLPPDPSQFFKRRHKVRDYPWHIHDAFHQQQQQQAAQHQQPDGRLARLHQMLEENRRHLIQLEELVALQFPPQQQQQQQQRRQQQQNVVDVEEEELDMDMATGEEEEEEEAHARMED